jgi:Family of unknown function (DUF6236)
MTFTRALYYPTINIGNEEWLKNAILYWDRVETIVPRSITKPYQGESQQACAEAGLLRPYHAADNPEVIERVGQSVLENFSAEGLRVMGSVDSTDARLNIEKVSTPLKAALLAQVGDNGNEWIFTSGGFADYYMTLLATEVAKDIDASPLSDNPRSYDFFNIAKRHVAPVEDNEAQAAKALVEVVMKGVNIDPKTPIERIIRFREKRKDELGRFREEVGNLVNSIKDVEARRMPRRAEDIYVNKIEPAVNALQTTLRDDNIAWALDGILKVCTFSVPATALATMAAATATVAASPVIMAGGLVTIGTLVARRYYEKRELQARNPYSYLLRLRSLH